MSIEMDKRLHILESRVAELERRLAAIPGDKSLSPSAANDANAPLPDAGSRSAKGRRPR